MKSMKSMKRFSLILSIFLLGVVLVSCGKSARMTSYRPIDISESSIVAEKSTDFILLEPQEAIVGVDPQGRTFAKEIYWKGVFIPGRTVILSSYYLGKCEVTYKLWQEVYDWNTRNDKGYSFCAGKKGSHGDDRNTENDPVTEVSWYDCVVWCNAYTEMIQGSTEQCVYRTNDSSKAILKSASIPSEVYFDQTKNGYRLPTEAEWEFAARYQRRDSNNALQYGNTYLTYLDSLSGAKANYNDDEENARVAWYGTIEDNTLPVGQKEPNDVGIYDMSGNVWEWCYDGWQDPLPTGTEEQIDPIGEVSVSDRVIRGGSRGNEKNSCVVGCRYYRNAGNSDYWEFLSSNKVGFRLAYSR